MISSRSMIKEVVYRRCHSRIVCRLGSVVLLLFQLRNTNAFTTSCHRSDAIHEGVCRTTRNVPIQKSRMSSSTTLFWGFFRRGNDSESLDETLDETKAKDDNTPVAETANKDAKVVVVVEPPKVLTPEEEAARLRSEAAKSRLEAERMDAELTLRKIDKLEKALKKQQMEIAVNDATTGTSKESPEEIQRQIDALLRKVRGEPAIPTAATTSSSESVSRTTLTSTMEPIWPKYIKPFDEAEYQKILDNMNGMPKIFLGPAALQVELETKKGTPINITQLSERLDKIYRQDFSYSKKKLPNFTQQQISELQKVIEDFMQSDKYSESPATGGGVDGKSWWSFFDGGSPNMFYETNEVNAQLQILKDDPRYQRLWDSKDTKTIATLILEYQHYMTITETDGEFMVKLVADEEWLKPFINAANISGTNAVIESLYPLCTTKKDIVFGTAMDNEPSPVPTEAQVKKLIADVLPKASFQVTSKPEPVLGGFIVRGTTKLSGDAFIEQLDAVMDKSNLNDQMSVFYVNDFSILGEEVDFDPSGSVPPSTPGAFTDGPPILYVASANICRESLPIRLSIVSAFGLATSWYFSVYPFLLNAGIATRVDEQLAIADANMVADLSWLSDLSLPLFATFMSIQLSHELGHLIIAGANGIKTSPPTFVPSLFTGITSAVTTFRSPPKNTATLFDYAAAGPLAGIITSILAIAVGCQITSVTPDASLFPALPLEILRQSTLGGGIIEFVLGNGVLSLPKAAIGTAAVAGMTVPLHPIAIAGFISLIINALAVLPIGTTDGGRMAIALFGRVFKISVATLALIAILFLGSFAGSDLFLFYFMFCVIFQRGNEIPARNEIDKLDLSRCFVAGGLYVVAALALIPFQ